MHTLSILAISSLLVSTLAFAGNDCPESNANGISAVDCSIIASVRPQPAHNRVSGLDPSGQECNHLTWMDLSDEDKSIIASVRRHPDSPISAHVLYTAADQFGRVGEEDLSQMRSVQPQGKKIILCASPTTTLN